MKRVQGWNCSAEAKLNLHIQLAPHHPKGLLLSNPVMVAAGTFGYGTEYADFIDIQRLGAIICKGTTLMPRKGNPQPRLVETASGLLNSVGLENIGVEALVREKAPIWANWQVPVIVNVAGEVVEEYVGVAQRLEGVPGISGIEINISCPNISAGGMEFGISPKLAAEVTSAVKNISSLPLIIKLSPNVTDIKEIALAVEEAGANAISLINTVKGMAIDIDKRKPCLGNITGGLSGPAIKPLALYMVYEVAKVVHVPVIGCGGIASSRDALEFIMCGASAVQIGTANLTNPQISLTILEGIENFMREKGTQDLTYLVGIAQGKS
ncbi:MAG: dihydroorotate dehydrogenase B catalytic subunit [Dehalococcoidia bacterium CG2_30_46_9]|nr:MAG: dihydroorotate dehydrogenase B catalytic subunit [Dehalococcoidia bacterium CG2_30_46_9]